MGSNQHSRRAHGVGLTMSGGSVPMFKQTTNATPDVFIFSFRRHDSLGSSEGGDYSTEQSNTEQMLETTRSATCIT